MAESEFEYCEIREAHLDSGFLGMGFGQPRPAYFVACQGDTILARSREFAFRTWDGSSLEGNQAAVAEQIRRYREGAHHFVLQRLLAEGWEPVEKDETGRVTNLRRSLASSAGQRVERAEVLRKLTFLRDVGVLSQDEFEIKKAGLLKSTMT